MSLTPELQWNSKVQESLSADAFIEELCKESSQILQWSNASSPTWIEVETPSPMRSPLPSRPSTRGKSPAGRRSSSVCAIPEDVGLGFDNLDRFGAWGAFMGQLDHLDLFDHVDQFVVTESRIESPDGRGSSSVCTILEESGSDFDNVGLFDSFGTVMEHPDHLDGFDRADQLVHPESRIGSKECGHLGAVKEQLDQFDHVDQLVDPQLVDPESRMASKEHECEGPLEEINEITQQLPEAMVYDVAAENLIQEAIHMARESMHMAHWSNRSSPTWIDTAGDLSQGSPLLSVDEVYVDSDVDVDSDSDVDSEVYVDADREIAEILAIRSQVNDDFAHEAVDGGVPINAAVQSITEDAMASEFTCSSR